MKKVFRIIFSGYLTLLFPLIVSVILLEKLHHLLYPVNQWIESKLHVSHLFGVLGVILISAVLMLFLGYLCGLLVRSTFVKKQIQKYEDSVLAKIPMYNLVKSILSTHSDTGPEKTFRPALLSEDESYSLCYITSESENYYTVYVSEGGLSGGEIQIVPKQRVKILNISLSEFTRLVKQYGINSASLAELTPKE